MLLSKYFCCKSLLYIFIVSLNSYVFIFPHLLSSGMAATVLDQDFGKTMERWLELKVPCKFCQRTFHSEMNLHRHIDKQHASQYIGHLKCPFCSFACDDQSQLSCHRNTVHRFICDTCQKTFSTYSGLKNHNKTMHGSAEGLYKCKCCGKLFESSSRLMLHERSHSDAKLYQCVRCDKEYKYKCSLDNHLKSCDGQK